MRFKITCTQCGAVIYVRGHDEPDVNAVVLDENDPAWADDTDDTDTCIHLRTGGDYIIGEAEYDDDSDDYNWSSLSFE
jgi:hypothetical protein